TAIVVSAFARSVAFVPGTDRCSSRLDLQLRLAHSWRRRHLGDWLVDGSAVRTGVFPCFRRRNLRHYDDRIPQPPRQPDCRGSETAGMALVHLASAGRRYCGLARPGGRADHVWHGVQTYPLDRRDGCRLWIWLPVPSRASSAAEADLRPRCHADIGLCPATLE